MDDLENVAEGLSPDEQVRLRELETDERIQVRKLEMCQRLGTLLSYTVSVCFSVFCISYYGLYKSVEASDGQVSYSLAVLGKFEVAVLLSVGANAALLYLLRSEKKKNQELRKQLDERTATYQLGRDPNRTSSGHPARESIGQEDG